MRVFFAFIEFQIIRTANDFSHSLLDFLESRVVKISGYEKRRLETNHWTEMTEGTFNVLQNPSQCEGFGCGHYHLHSSIHHIRHCNIHSLQLQPNQLRIALKQKTSTPALS